MKKRWQIKTRVFAFFIPSFLLLTSLLYLTGCTLTPKAIQLANEKAAPQYEYRNITKIESVIMQENGDVSLCVELDNPDGIEKPKLKTITIPLAMINAEANQDVRHGFHPGECPSRCYWYPIEKVENGCDKITPENASSKSILPIEKLTIYSQDQLYEFIDSHNENQKITGKIYEVSHVSSHTSEIYWFAQIDRQRIAPSSIAGVYEDTSTNLYYLTVPAAMVGDLIIGVVVVAVTITGVAFGIYLRTL
ncbi:MAG: hypothetical protein JRH12_17990 [Deltaproteobacteria bacterium]|jgi:hypothetical protein|nr:hypothetical protein [Deltaproteobacteria bacterium]